MRQWEALSEQETALFYEKLMARANRPGTFTTYNHMRVTAVGDGWAEGELDVASDSGNPLGIVHGGCLCTMMDQVSGTAACSRGAVCRTVNCDIHYLSAAADCKKLYSKATLLQRGRNIAVFATQVTDGSGTLCAAGTYTFRLKQEDLDAFLYGEASQ